MGSILYVLLIIIAFTGYVLPWGQISYWAATVITRLFSVIPKVGGVIVRWLWGGYCVGDATLKRFFVFHFLSPFIMVVLVAIHIMYLHETGSSNPLGVNRDREAVPFHPYYTLKDLVGVIVILLFFGLSVFLYPDVFMAPENFEPANPMMTPAQVKPE